MNDKANGQRPPLPSGWVWATIGDTGEYLNGVAFKPSDWGSEGTPIIRIQNLTDSAREPNRTLRQVPDIYKVHAGDLLVSWSATLDAFVWRGEPALLNQHISKVLPAINEQFLYYLCRWAIQQMIKSEHLHGSTMAHINRGPFLAHEVPLPPLTEQARIASAIDTVFGEIEAGEQELQKAREGLETYRRAVLKAAVTGDLTKAWRDKNPLIETGFDLLAEIEARRQKTVPTRGRRSSSRRVDDGDLRKLQVPPEWVCAALEDLVIDGPTNGYSPKASKTEAGTLALKLTATTRGVLDLSARAVKRLSEVVPPHSDL